MAIPKRPFETNLQTNCQDENYYDPIADNEAPSHEHKCGYGVGVGFIRFDGDGSGSAAHKIIGCFIVMEWQFFVFDIGWESLLKNLLNRCVHRVFVNGFELSKIEHNACLYFPQRSWARPTPC